MGQPDARAGYVGTQVNGKSGEREGGTRMIRRGQRGRIGIFQTVRTFTLGLGLGGALAVLFAPASGRVTRRRLGSRVNELQRLAGRRFNRTRKDLLRTASNLGEVAAEKIHDAREWVTDRVANGYTARHGRRRAVRHA